MIIHIGKTLWFCVQRLFGIGGWRRQEYTDSKDKKHTVYGRMIG